MEFIENIKNLAKQNKKRIILPESMDERVLDAAIKCRDLNIADIILIGNKEEISKIRNINNFEGIQIIDPKTFEYTEKIIDLFYELRRNKGLTREEAKDLILNDYMYFACMLVKLNIADGITSGACHSTANTLRPALQIIKTKENTKLVSSFFLMEIPNCNYGENGLFVFADCGLEPNPDSEKLASIAITSADTFEKIVGKKSYTALLSYSTKGSAKHDNLNKVIEATKIAKDLRPDLEIDGELQLDAAIDLDVAKLKAKDSNVAGKANVLIFPDLNSGNIGYKLVHRLAKANSYGPITQGIAKPVNDLSRGCSVDDIVGVVAITAYQACTIDEK